MLCGRPLQRALKLDERNSHGIAITPDFDNAAWPTLIFRFGPPYTLFDRLSVAWIHYHFSFSRCLSGGAVSTFRIRSFALALLQGTAETVGLGSRRGDIGAVSDAIDQRLAEPGVGNYLGPFRERQVGGDDHGRLFSSICNHLE